MAEEAKLIRSLVGKVVTDGMQKTAVVQIERKIRHPLYGKYVKRFSKMFVHDEDDVCKKGDVVRIASCRPISKKKCWRLVEVVEKAD